MRKNVTLKLDERLLRKARQIAVAKDKSLSEWMTELLWQAIADQSSYAAAKRRALRRLERGFPLGGRPLSRDEVHDR